MPDRAGPPRAAATSRWQRPACTRTRAPRDGQSIVPTRAARKRPHLRCVRATRSQADRCLRGSRPAPASSRDCACAAARGTRRPARREIEIEPDNLAVADGGDNLLADVRMDGRPDRALRKGVPGRTYGPRKERRRDPRADVATPQRPPRFASLQRSHRVPTRTPPDGFADAVAAGTGNVSLIPAPRILMGHDAANRRGAKGDRNGWPSSRRAILSP